MNRSHMADIHTSALIVMQDPTYTDDERNGAHIVAELILSNLLVIAGGTAEQRSTDTCQVFAVWTPVANAFTALFASTDYPVARLSMHS